MGRIEGPSRIPYELNRIFSCSWLDKGIRDETLLAGNIASFRFIFRKVIESRVGRPSRDTASELKLEG